jgi:hypothetical protein
LFSNFLLFFRELLSKNLQVEQDENWDKDSSLHV